MTGAAAIACPLRFSTKYEDAETHWLNYTFRLYNPSTGRWRNRDPFEEFGGFNVYSFSLNAPTIHIDTDGRVVLESVGAATSVGTGIGSTAGTSFTGISQTFTFVGGGSSGAAGAGAAGAGTLFAGGAIGFVGGYAAGRIIDNATDGALSDIYAGTFSRWTDWWYNSTWEALVSGQPGQSRASGTLTQQDLAQRRREHDAYSRRCNEPPPPGLDPCAEAHWKLQRNLDCRRLRQNFADKWFGGTYDSGHFQYMQNLDQAIRNLEDCLKQNCKPCP